MLVIQVINNTFLKRSTASSSTLSDRDKIAVTAGKTFKIKFYTKKDRHFRVCLAEDMDGFGKVGFFFEDDIQVEEIRGVWLTNIDSDILRSKANILSGLSQLKKSGFNTIYPVVWNKGFVFFKSSLVNNTVDSDRSELAEVNLERELAGRDVLAEIIEVNKELNNHFRVVPWLEYGLMVPPEAPLVAGKPEWFMRTQDDEATVNGNFWLNPSHPEVQNFFRGLVHELAKNYSIDGIQLDDHFVIPNFIGEGSLFSMGFDRFTLDLFKRENPGAISPVGNPQLELFKKWRRTKLTDLLRIIFKEVKDVNPDNFISISPNPLEFSVQNFLADWQAWQREGLAEEIVLQVYRPESTSFIGEITKPEVEEARGHIPTSIGIMSGLKPDDRRVPVSSIKEQTQLVRSRDFAGFVYFFYGSLFAIRPTGESEDSRISSIDGLLGVDRFV